MLIKVSAVTVIADSERNLPGILIREKEGERTFIVPVDFSEANAVAIKTMGISTNAPGYTDTLLSLLRALGGNLVRAILKKNDDGFTATLSVKDRDDRVISLDCRAGDAVALALDSEAPLFAEENVFEGAGLPDTAGRDGLPKLLAETSVLRFGRYYLN